MVLEVYFRENINYIPSHHFFIALFTMIFTLIERRESTVYSFVVKNIHDEPESELAIEMIKT